MEEEDRKALQAMQRHEQKKEEEEKKKPDPASEDEKGDSSTQDEKSEGSEAEEAKFRCAKSLLPGLAQQNVKIYLMSEDLPVIYGKPRFSHQFDVAVVGFYHAQNATGSFPAALRPKAQVYVELPRYFVGIKPEVKQKCCEKLRSIVGACGLKQTESPYAHHYLFSMDQTVPAAKPEPPVVETKAATAPPEEAKKEAEKKDEKKEEKKEEKKDEDPEEEKSTPAAKETDKAETK